MEHMRHSHAPTRPLSNRRGVASVLAMMFLVIFGSLAAAMAVVAAGNLRSADQALRVSTASSAAETGLRFAAWQLEREARRFVVERGDIDAPFAQSLWLGGWDSGSMGSVEVLPPDGYTAPNTPTGLADALLQAHQAALHNATYEPGDEALPSFNPVTLALDVKPIPLDATDDAPYFRLRYELIPGEAALRVSSTGVHRDTTRRLSMEFRLDKRIEYAVVSPNRIMIGKNVMVFGPLGTRYGENPGELNGGNGDPLSMRSDFYYLSSALDAKLDAFYLLVQAYDVDDDARLRPDHVTEGAALIGQGFLDTDGDEFVDEFDLLLDVFDSDGDGQLCYDPALASQAGLGTLAQEFADIDDQLAHLVDNARADRNIDGVIDMDDTRLGYRDGVLSSWDRYAKVSGRLAFAVERAVWEAEHGAPIRSVVQGSERPGPDEAAMLFAQSPDALRVVTTDMFSTSAVYFHGVAQAGSDFQTQVDFNLAHVTEAIHVPAEDAPWEETPLGSRAAYDWYQRPIYRNMEFENCMIPVGTNALFESCTFLGVTYLETFVACEDINWNYAGAVEQVELDGGGYEYEPRFGDLTTQHPVEGELADSKPFSNNTRFEGCTFLGSLAADTPGEYTHWRNKAQFTGATRFFVDPLDPDLAIQPDGATLRLQLESLPADQLSEMARSSIMMPGWSVDVGSFTNEVAGNLDETPRVELRGIIIAGILDVRGTARVRGTLLMTFRPIPGEGPLFYDGQPDAFNTTIGFFGPLDGDGEGTDPTSESFQGFGEIVLAYDPDVRLPDGIPWPILAEPIAATYKEGAP